MRFQRGCPCPAGMRLHQSQAPGRVGPQLGSHYQQCEAKLPESLPPPNLKTPPITHVGVHGAVNVGVFPELLHPGEPSPFPSLTRHSQDTSFCPHAPVPASLAPCYR